MIVMGHDEMLPPLLNEEVQQRDGIASSRDANDRDRVRIQLRARTQRA